MNKINYNTIGKKSLNIENKVNNKINFCKKYIKNYKIKINKYKNNKIKQLEE